INVEKARRDKVRQNNEIRTMITAVGTGIGKGEGEGAFNLEKLRYHKIIIMTDADVDGSHIRTLLLTFFYRQMTQLIKGGYVYIAQPPLYQITRRKRVEYVDDDAQLNKILIQLGTEDVRLRNLADSKELSQKQLAEILELLESLDKYANALRRHGGDFAESLELHESKAVGELLSKISRKGFNVEHYSAQDTPLFEMIEGEGEKAQVKPIFSIAEILSSVKEVGRRGLQIKRFKGLGEMNPKELFETTMNPANRKLLSIELTAALEAEEMFTRLMGDEVEPRKRFIEDNALNV